MVSYRIYARTIRIVTSEGQNDERSVKNRRPIGPLVSTFSRREMNVMPRASNSSMTYKKCLTLLKRLQRAGSFAADCA